jgi:mannose-1-phosphate guanylyltransferase
MKAVLLAAGKGERLGKITETIPKPMLTVFGKPVIAHNIEMCRQFGINDIYINLHHLSEVIVKYLGDGKSFGVSITYSFEEEILGTSGGIKNIFEKLSGESFFVIYADNYSNYDLGTIYDKHCKANADMSIALFQSENVSQSGVVIMDKCDRIITFVEKPGDKLVDSHWVNAGIYLIEPCLMEDIPDGFSDFGRDIIPKYIAYNYKLIGVKMPNRVVAIDTPSLFEKRERAVKIE